MSDNPYAAVQVGLTTGPSDATSNSILSIARRVFLAWEKLRIAFIGILAVPTILMLAASSQVNLSLFILIGFGAVVANVCYMAGPIFETYMQWLGIRTLWLRATLFAAGTLFTAVAAIISIGLQIGMFR